MSALALLYEHPWWTTLWLLIICAAMPIARGK